MSPRMRNRAGFSLTELLVTLLIFSAVTASAFGFLLSNVRGMRQMSDRSDQIQTGRFSRDILRQEMRTAGTNVTEDQPMLVYASDSVFAFNADIISNRRDSSLFTGAIYVDPYASDDEAAAMALSSAQAIPGTSFTYPLADYAPIVGTTGEAETVIYRFAPDTASPDPDAYMLLRQVNAMPAEMVASGLRKVSGQPFFRYWYDPSRYDNTATSLTEIPTSWLPLAKTVAMRGIEPDTGTAVTTRIDQIRAVEVTYEATRASDGSPDEVRFMVPMPNTGADRQSRACGRPPLSPTAPNATWVADSLAVILTWSPAVDDGGGEQDAVRYVLFRRLNGSATWGNPLAGVSATAGAPGYRYKDSGVEVGSGLTYDYALAVQDCTPNVSGLAASAAVVVP
jgi:prepilin-type N-terminal cleavage/methylation domain-containing protein